jgi:enoyl-CoA hydratase/carnithine racemase
MTKPLLWEAQASSLANILEMSAAMQTISHATADNKEAIAAFVEKRSPVFTGE